MVGGNAANLRQAIEGETYEHEVMYRRFAEEARQDGDPEAAKLFGEIAADEGRHRDAFRTALAVVTTGGGTIPAPPKADMVSVPAGMPKVKAARTKANLDTAMHGEGLAHAKYMLFAAHARQTGNAALARLWRARPRWNCGSTSPARRCWPVWCATPGRTCAWPSPVSATRRRPCTRGSPNGPPPSVTAPPPASSATPPRTRPGTQPPSRRHSTG